MSSAPDTCWPHAPTHKLGGCGVTAATYKKLHHFRGADRLAVLHRGLLAVAQQYNWRMEAWAVFSNHYHFVAHSPETEDSAESLRILLGELHSKTARWVNGLDHALGRHVWHNYRETLLTFERSYFSRLNYTHHNAVKHGLVPKASLYTWCSASWLEQTAIPAQVQTIYGFKTDKLRITDNFDPAPEW